MQDRDESVQRILRRPLQVLPQEVLQTHRSTMVQNNLQGVCRERELTHDAGLGQDSVRKRR